jgi:hypothetical protein
MTMTAGYPDNDLMYLRQVVDPTLTMLPPRQLRLEIDSAFGEGFADSVDQDLESIFSGIGRSLSSAARDVGRFAQKAAPVVTTIGGGIVQGAMAGSAGGIPGIIAGAAVGGTGAGLSRYGSGAARQVGGALSGVTNLVGGFTPMGQAGKAIGSTIGGLGQLAGGRASPGQVVGQFGQMAGGGRAMGGMGALSQMFGGGAGGGGGRGGSMGALGGLMSAPQLASMMGGLFGGNTPVSQLASVMQRPETHQAIAALRLGDHGRPTIPVGTQQQPVPTAVFAQLLSHLAQQTVSQSTGLQRVQEAEAIGFMSDGESGFLGDPASESDRAARLWEMLNDAQAERFVEVLDYETAAFENETQTEGEAEIDAETEWYDALDLADAEAIEFALESESRHGW